MKLVFGCMIALLAIPLTSLAAPSECLKSAMRIMSFERSIALCGRLENDAIESIDCFKEINRGLNTDDAIRLCAISGTMETANCYHEANRGLLSHQAINLCRLGGDLSNVECFREYSRSLNTDKAIQVCQNREIQVCQ